MLEGDKNTKFFHIMTLKYRAYNQINELCNNKGVEISKGREIKKVVIKYF